MTTAGPWKANLAGKDRVHASVTGANGKAVATFKVSKTCPAAEANANATLCAAALDLLELSATLAATMDGSTAKERDALADIRSILKVVK